MNPWCPINRVGPGMNGPLRERRIGRCLSRAPAIAPRIVPNGGDAQHPAQGDNAVDGPVHFLEPEDLGGTDPPPRTMPRLLTRSPALRSAACSPGASSSSAALVGPSRRTPASRAAAAEQINHLLPELRRIWWFTS